MGKSVIGSLDEYRTRKGGNFTPEDVLTKSKEVIEEFGAERVIAIVQTKDGVIRRFNTQMDNVELTGLLETTKLYEYTD